ncbi:MAG: hypothetical protein AAF608_06940 [Pseudomonadota bacterium]
MILRSRTGEAAAPLWVAAILEFVIVAVGVFLGLQAANWNEARFEVQRERVLLERLLADFERIVETGDLYQPEIELQSPATRLIIDTIRSGEEPALEGAFADALERVNQVWVNLELAPTYEELVASGSLSRVQDDELRDMLARYRRAQAADVGLIAGQLAMRDSVVVERAVRYRIEDTGFETSNIPVAMDWDALVALEPHLQVMLRSQIQRTQWQRATLELARDIRDTLRADLELPATP